MMYPKADIVGQPRAYVEQNLTFAGFIAFRCLIRRDSATVISNLKVASEVSMSSSLIPQRRVRTRSSC